MKRFIVEITKPENYITYTEAFETEQTRFADLIHEKLLLQVHMNTDHTCYWLIFEVESMAIMQEVLATIPLCMSIERKIYELIQ